MQSLLHPLVLFFSLPCLALKHGNFEVLLKDRDLIAKLVFKESVLVHEILPSQVFAHSSERALFCIIRITLLIDVLFNDSFLARNLLSGLRIFMVLGVESVFSQSFLFA